MEINITCEPIQPEQKEMLSRLFELYAYEFSPYVSRFRLNEEGEYRPVDVDVFLNNPDYESYLVRVNQEIAGFVLVKQIIESAIIIHTIDQFFIAKPYGGKGIGKAVAKHIFDLHPGKWRVQQKEKNYRAQAFWRTLIKEYTQDEYVERFTPERDVIQEFIREENPLTLPVNEDTYLRRIQIADAPTLFARIDKSREHLRQWLPWLDQNQSVLDTECFIRESLNMYYYNHSFNAGIFHKKELVGCISFHLINWPHRHTSIGYWLAEEFQGRGIMTESCKAMIDYAFNSLGLNKVTIKAATGNTKSQAIPKRLGFQLEGCNLQEEWLYDRFVDLNVYSMLAKDWPASQQSTTQKAFGE